MRNLTISKRSAEKADAGSEDTSARSYSFIWRLFSAPFCSMSVAQAKGRETAGLLIVDNRPRTVLTRCLNEPPRQSVQRKSHKQCDDHTTCRNNRPHNVDRTHVCEEDATPEDGIYECATYAMDGESAVVGRFKSTGSLTK